MREGGKGRKEGGGVNGQRQEGGNRNRENRFSYKFSFQVCKICDTSMASVIVATCINMSHTSPYTVVYVLLIL